MFSEVQRKFIENGLLINQLPVSYIRTLHYLSCLSVCPFKTGLKLLENLSVNVFGDTIILRICTGCDSISSK